MSLLLLFRPREGAAAATVVTGMFDAHTPAYTSGYDPATPSATSYDAPTPSSTHYDPPTPS